MYTNTIWDLAWSELETVSNDTCVIPIASAAPAAPNATLRGSVGSQPWGAVNGHASECAVACMRACDAVISFVCLRAYLCVCVCPRTPLRLRISGPTWGQHPN